MNYGLIRGYSGGGIALALIAKTGTQSFKEVIDVDTGWYLVPSEALEYPVRVFFMRHPVDRLKSAFSFFIKLRNEGAQYDPVKNEVIETWPKFVDHILTHSDEHWDPQIPQVTYKGEFTPNKVLRFEDVKKWWPNFSSIRLPHANASIPQETLEYRVEELKALYAEDMQLWKSITPFDDLPEADRKWPL